MNLKTGIAASIGAALCFTIMDAFVKSLGHIGTGELTFFRGLIGLAFLPVLAHFSRTPVFSGKTGFCFCSEDSLEDQELYLYFYPSKD